MKFFNRKWWWILGESEGRFYLWGPYNSWDKANEMGSEKFDSDFDTMELPTRDEAKASRMVKAKRLGAGESLGEATTKLHHRQYPKTTTANINPDRPERRYDDLDL